MRAIGERSLRARKWGGAAEAADPMADQTTSMAMVSVSSSGPGPTTSQNNGVDSRPGISPHGLYEQWGPRLIGGEVFWSQCFWIYASAFLTYSFNNSGPFRTNVQISISVFVGGQNIIGATSGMNEETEIEIAHYAWLAVLSAVVASVWWSVSRLKLFDGYAGRLGTTTFLGMNLSMLIFVPADVVSWKLYIWGFLNLVHVGEEESSTSPKVPYSWTQEAESAIVYVLGVLWLGVLSGGTRLLNKRRIEGTSQSPINNILTPVVYALSSMLVVNATDYVHAPAIFNGFCGRNIRWNGLFEESPKPAEVCLGLCICFSLGLDIDPMLHRIRRQEKKALALTDSTYATVSRSNEIVNSARAGKSGFTAFLGHITFDLSRKTFGRIHDVLKLREISNFPPSERIGNTDDPESNDQHVYEEETAHQHSHKPKKDGVLQTKQQLRQQKRLKHNQDNV
ncbi:hypothetical protein THAOC_10794, partial [Thalassiosira oceanica]